ncbi:MAG: hypothetical protein ACI82Z_001448 [Cellvibrionaceae bacterium]|jgi:hypothetical protein
MFKIVIDKPLLAHKHSSLKPLIKKIVGDENAYLLIDGSSLKSGDSKFRRHKFITIIRLYLEMREIKIRISSKMVKSLDSEFFEEIPEGNLKIPFDLLDNWYRRLESDQASTK